MDLLKEKDLTLRTRFFYIIENLETGEAIGFISLKITSSEIVGGTASFGYMISGKYKGKGYATEAARGILDFGFRTLNLGNIAASIASENTPSIRIAAKLGMKQIETVDESFCIYGKTYDEIKCSINRADFNSD